MKFYLMVLLDAQSVATADDDAIRALVQQRMAAHGDLGDEQDLPPRWDYHFCCDKDWLREAEPDHVWLTLASRSQQLLVLAPAALDPAGLPAAVLTADGQWHESNAGILQVDPAWPARAQQLLRAHHEVLAVVVYAHR